MKKIITALAITGIAIAGVSCNTTANRERDAALKAQQYTIDSMKMEMAKKQVIDSMNEVAKTQMVIPQMINPVVQPVQQAPAVQQKARTHYVARRTVHHYNGSAYREPARNYAQTSAPAYQNTQYVSQQAPVQQKRGWSAKAKGAAIGAGVGAVGGALINGRNRGVGALIGAGVGALGGLGTGAVIDKRNGR
jgi:hypothetical protein